MLVDIVRFAGSASGVGSEAFSGEAGPRPADRRESLRRDGGIHRKPMPFPARLVLALAIFLLGGGVLLASVEAVNGGVRLVAGAVTRGGTPAAAGPGLELGATPLGFMAPRLLGPAHVFTNAPTFTLTGTLAAGVAAHQGYFVRVYREAPEPALLHVIPVGRLPWFKLADIALMGGTNTFVATLVAPAGETVQSNKVSVVFTTAKPRITLTSPAAGAKVADATVGVAGTVPDGSFVVVRNTTSGNGVAATAADGAFTAIVPLARGANDLLVTVTDQAGNSNELKVTLTRLLGPRR